MGVLVLTTVLAVDFPELILVVFVDFGSVPNPTTAPTAMIRITTTAIPIMNCVFMVASGYDRSDQKEHRGTVVPVPIGTAFQEWNVLSMIF